MKKVVKYGKIKVVVKYDNFEFFQPNEKRTRAADCSVRAMCKVLNKTWLEAFDIMVEEARKQQDDISAGKVIKQVLLDHGFTYYPVSNKKGSKRPKVFEKAKEITGNCVAFFMLANHVVSASDGKYYDIWDSGDCCLYGYYVKGDYNENTHNVSGRKQFIL